MVKKAIKLVGVTQLLIFFTYFLQDGIYANVQVAALSSFLVIIGSFYAHSKMVKSQVAQKNYVDERDVLDTIDDPHGLYDEGEDLQEGDDVDFKQIVKEEKAKIKIFSFKTMKEGGGAGFSLFRLLPYLFLVLGFIALKNNEILDISIYLPSLLVGIILGSLVSKELVF